MLYYSTNRIKNKTVQQDTVFWLQNCLNSSSTDFYNSLRTKEINVRYV